MKKPAAQSNADRMEDPERTCDAGFCREVDFAGIQWSSCGCGRMLFLGYLLLYLVHELTDRPSGKKHY